MPATAINILDVIGGAVVELLATGKSKITSARPVSTIINVGTKSILQIKKITKKEVIKLNVLRKELSLLKHISKLCLVTEN